MNELLKKEWGLAGSGSSAVCAWTGCLHWPDTDGGQSACLHKLLRCVCTSFAASSAAAFAYSPVAVQ